MTFEKAQALVDLVGDWPASEKASAASGALVRLYLDEGIEFVAMEKRIARSHDLYRGFVDQLPKHAAESGLELMACCLWMIHLLEELLLLGEAKMEADGDER